MNSKQASINDISRFSFGSIVPNNKHDESNESSDIDFLPEVEFDDFHRSLATEGPDLNSFPAPGRGGMTLQRPTEGSNMTDRRTDLKESSKRDDLLDTGSRIVRNNSLVYRLESRTNQGNKTGGNFLVPSASAPALKQRRKSHFPSSTITGELGSSRPPRKSVGLGNLNSDITQLVSQKRKPSAGQVNSTRPNGFAYTGERMASQHSPGTMLDGQAESPREMEFSWNKKTNLFEQSPRLANEHFPSTPETLSKMNALKVNTLFSPAISPGQRTNTPSSGKRASMMPGSSHATGLGARTISPTDARRMKRMSIVPNPPPVPSTPPTPQPDSSYVRPRSSAHSPSMIPRKSITPSSSRTTPEANRKSYSSGISNSSSTSYSSFLNPMGSSRMFQSQSTSRLPTLKSRIESVSAGGEEEVPPVPAIPKAYESPKGEFDQSFFSLRKSSLPYETSSQASTGTTEGVTPYSISNGFGPLEREKHQRRGLTVDEGSVDETKPSAGTSNSRRTLQPLRLPPLNLLPLSTPTAAKIAALYEGTASMNLGNITPPPKLKSATPSTPMTASKASFFPKSSRDEHPMTKATQRPNSSSYHKILTDSSSYRVPSSSSSTMPVAHDQYAGKSSRKAISPFVSSSLPKSSGDFNQLENNAGATNSVENGQEIRNPRLTGPRAQKTAKAFRDDDSNIEDQNLIGNSMPSIGSSLRHKLSLNRKRSGSKIQTSTDLDIDVPPKPPKHDQMPPPRLPASATWNGPSLPSPSPTQRLHMLNTKRKVSNSNIRAHHDRSRSNTWTADGSPKKESALPGPTIPTATSTRVTRPTLDSSSLSTSLSLKDFLRETKTMDLQLDRDDLLAEDEMKRLAAKRKDTESAAREMDALRRRATAKERVSPNQAIRMANLNIFERGEIVDYNDIYFCGTQGAKKHVGDLTVETANFGYDDERGDYNIVKGDHLLYRYEIVDILGKGSFGQVVRCIDHRTGGLVALKIIRNKKRFHQQALVEVDILQKLREWVGSILIIIDLCQLLIFETHRIHQINIAWLILRKVFTSEAIFAFARSYLA